MNEVKWTSDQQNAIDHRGSSLLISAAAGSGKTAVLVERLIGYIVKERRDITDFLVITYTKAAASELRKKISRALREQIASNPGDRHLRRQLVLVGSARISTVHAFCSWVLRNCGNLDGVSALSRILDESEGELILSDILNELIEEKYEARDEEFLALAAYMNDGRSDRLLFSSVLDLYKKSKSHPYPEKWLMKIAEDYDVSKVLSVSDTIWGRETIRDVCDILETACRTLEIVLEDIGENPDLDAIYHEYISDTLTRLRACISDDWDALLASVSAFAFEKRPSSRGLADKTFPKTFKELIDILKDDITSIPEKLMLAESSTLLSEIRALRPTVLALCNLARELDERFAKEKLRRGVLDYSDLEHFCIKLLVESYDEETDSVLPSAVASDLSASFHEILLDEFQDSNLIQDVIFRAVSKAEKNIVMVGDVKQSIYAFRLADPSIFMKKYKTFGSFDEASGDEPRVITLSQNFRSREEILDTANGLFSRIMTETLGGVDYNKDHFLYPRNDIPEISGMETEFCLLDYVKGDEKGISAEARFTARKIRELVDGKFIINDKDEGARPCRYSDFAVLLRSTSTNADFYEHEFEALGIPYSSPKPEALLSKSEISAVVSLLSVVDNPTADIPLIATLKSPMFAFSADDLCELKREKQPTFIAALRTLAAKEGDAAAKSREFLGLLGTLRSLSRGMSASELIWEIYNRTNALGMFGALPCGAERQKNLLEFYKCAEEFEALGYQGLYKFISHITRLQENGGDIVVPKTSARDSVTIMTMHKSKGLEFPIVFVGNAIRNFNLDDIKSSVLFHPKLGIGPKFKDEESALHCTTLMRETIRRRILSEQKSEEMRLLYVALTRAREKMFITASRDNAPKKLSELFYRNPYPALDAINLARRNDASTWFLLPLLRTSAGRELFEYADVATSSADNTFRIKAYVIKATEIGCEENEDGERAAPSKLPPLALPEFTYPHVASSLSPSKLTATKLGAKAQDATTASHKRPTRPRFIREKALSPAERGTALHMAMQFADFSKCDTPDGAENELRRLLDEKFLSKAQAEAVDPARITAFLNSDIGRAMRSADKVAREFKFSVLLPAGELLGEDNLPDEKILLQGVIDLYFEKDGEITIVDFKTDRHRPEGEVLGKYTAQLHAYARALFEMTGKTAKKAVLYLVQCDDFIEV